MVKGKKITTTTMPFVTSSIDEVNILNGVTSTTDEINYLDITNLGKS